MNQDRVWRLQNHHRWLEQRLREEIRRPNPDAFIVQDLKRQKLLVKDELFLAEAKIEPALRELERA
mgnify:CR=1 FL=1